MNRIVLEKFWKKSVTVPYDSVITALFFFLLVLAEPVYRVVFSLHRFFLKLRPVHSSIPLISVGNLSVGGTGKSVVVAFLLEQLRNKKCAVVTRGYKRQTSKKGSYLINNGKDLIVAPEEAGDEPAMIATRYGVPVVVGGNREASLRIVESIGDVEAIILDDAYQHPEIKKQCEILLLDARRPFDNGHCLPAGMLREKDYSRADIIILTHADRISLSERIALAQQLRAERSALSVFFTRHQPAAVRLRDGSAVATSFLQGKKVVVLSAIAQGDNFVTTLSECGATIAHRFDFPDHHAYTDSDIAAVFDVGNRHAIDGVVMTAKDWPKVFPLLHYKEEANKIRLLVLEIGLHFLEAEQADLLMGEIRERVEQ